MSPTKKRSRIPKWIKKQNEQKAVRKHQIIQHSLEGKLSVAQASKLLGLSERQEKRLRKEVSEKGVDVITHGNKNRQPSTTISSKTRQEIIKHYRNKYAGANFQHYTELLAEHEDIVVSVSSVKNILKSEGIQSPKKRRKPKKHRRRQRKGYAGELVQTDATPHDFFGTGQKVCLHGVIDDATGHITGLYMAKHECLDGYLNVFEQMITNLGIPTSVYADRHTIFASPTANKLTHHRRRTGRKNR